MSTAELRIILTEEQEAQEFLKGLASEATEVFDASQVGMDAYLDHLLERLREREIEIAATNEVAERRIQMIEGWRREANGRAERESRWIRHLITGLARDYEFPKGKRSRSLPNGSFGIRRGQDTLEIVDTERAVAFAEAHGLEVKKTVNKTPLKDHFKATGEIPDGTEFVPGSEEFFVKVSS